MLDWVKFRRLPSKRRLLIRDSKQLTAKQRGELIPLLSDLCTVWHVASATAEEIDDLGIVAATFLAMRRAIAACNRPIDMLLIDGKWPVPNYDGPQQAVIKGDFLCYSIAAASILAKEVRDSYMHEQAGLFPAYGFESHVGYGTKRHLAMIERYGICPLHRTTFAPIKSYACTNTPTSLR
jgi:ribonuclease HII